MKSIVKRAIREEKGNVFILVLILLVVGGLVLTPMLGLMSTGLVSGQIYEKKTHELYAADAGVEDAVWKIQDGTEVKPPVACGDPTSWNYTISDVNDKSVAINITYDATGRGFLVNSTATGDGSGTRVEAYISGTPTYISLLDHLVTVQERLDDQEVEALEKDLAKLGIDCPESCTQCDKCWKAYDYDSDDYRDIPKECKGCIAVHNLPSAAWPTEDSLSARYWEDVENETPYDSDSIDLNGVDMNVGPLKRLDTLEILNSDQTAATLALNGTLYITGHTEIGMHGTGGPPTLFIELNNQTIFVACNYTKEDGYALEIGPWCTVNGPGAIVAVGDIYFQPNGDVGINAEPALVLSVAGTTMIQPNINFLGAIGGKIGVNLQSGHANVDYPASGFDDINFPSLFEAYLDYGISSWEVSGL